MKLAKQIAEEQERSGVAYSDDLCACFDIYVAEKIIAEKLEPVKRAFSSLLEEYIELISNGDCGYCDVDNDKEITSLRVTLAMFDNE